MLNATNTLPPGSPPPFRYPARRHDLRPPDLYIGPASPPPSVEKQNTPSVLGIPSIRKTGNKKSKDDIRVDVRQSPESGRYTISMVDRKGSTATITTACSAKALPDIIRQIGAVYAATRSDPERQIRMMTVKLIMFVLTIDSSPTATLDSAAESTNNDGRWGIRIDGAKIDVRKGSDLVRVVASAMSRRAAELQSQTLKDKP